MNIYSLLPIFLFSTFSHGALVITEFVYDVCNDAQPGLNDGNGGNNGEYVIITNTGSTGIDVIGFELDDDGDATDGDGMIISNMAGSLIIDSNSALVFAGTSRMNWEAEYGMLDPSIEFFNINDAGLSWQALNNTGDNIAFTDATNNGSYADLASDGETMIWDPASSSFISGGNVSLTCGVQEIIPGSVSLALAPEPSSLSLIALGAIAMIQRRKR